MGLPAIAMNGMTSAKRSRRVGHYELLAPIARGGMATVYLAQRVGPGGFARVFVAKRLHAHLAEDPEFVTMFMDEARIGSSLQNVNVVPVLDVARAGEDAVLVLEYVHGVSLDVLLSDVSGLMGSFPVPIALAIINGVLAGLQAAHDAVDHRGESLQLVHRDVSPQNVIVSAEGVPRLIDFGIAKATSSSHVTRVGFFKGKLAYMTPEQLREGRVTRAVDIYAAGVLLWEMLAGRRPFEHREGALGRGESAPVPPLGEVIAAEQGFVSAERRRQLELLEPIVARAVHPSPSERFATAAEMSAALTAVARSVTTLELGAWVRDVGAAHLEELRTTLAVAQGTAFHRRASSPEMESPQSARTSEIVPRTTESDLDSWSARRRTPALTAALVLLAAAFFTLAAVLVVSRSSHVQRVDATRPSAPRLAGTPETTLATSRSTTTSATLPPAATTIDVGAHLATPPPTGPAPTAAATPDVPRVHWHRAASPQRTDAPPSTPPPAASHPRRATRPFTWKARARSSNPSAYNPSRRERGVAARAAIFRSGQGKETTLDELLRGHRLIALTRRPARWLAFRVPTKVTHADGRAVLCTLQQSQVVRRAPWTPSLCLQDDGLPQHVSNSHRERI